MILLPSGDQTGARANPPSGSSKTLVRFDPSGLTVQIAPVGCRRSSVKTIVDPSGDQRAVHHGERRPCPAHAHRSRRRSRSTATRRCRSGSQARRAPPDRTRSGCRPANSRAPSRAGVPPGRDANEIRSHPVPRRVDPRSATDPFVPALKRDPLAAGRPGLRHEVQRPHPGSGAARTPTHRSRASPPGPLPVTSLPGMTMMRLPSGERRSTQQYSPSSYTSCRSPPSASATYSPPSVRRMLPSRLLGSADAAAGRCWGRALARSHDQHRQDCDSRAVHRCRDLTRACWSLQPKQGADQPPPPLELPRLVPPARDGRGSGRAARSLFLAPPLQFTLQPAPSR